MKVHQTYDLLVLGGGSGGVAAARRAGALGVRVGLCEERQVGGTCVHRGCIPKKLLVQASRFPGLLEMAGGHGWEVPPARLDFSRLQQAIRTELQRLEGIYLGMLERAGVDLHRGHARFLDAHTVEVEGVRLQGRKILIATGARPFLPEIPAARAACVSDDIFERETLPRRILVVGSGYIGSEFASLLHALGCEVTLVFRSQHLLPGFDGDLRQDLTESMRTRGIRILPGTRLEDYRPESEMACLTLSDGSQLQVDLILFATGRVPNTLELGLEKAGVQVNQTGGIVVDEFSCTNLPHIFAVGDVTQRVQLTPVAIAEARALVETLFMGNPTPVRYELIPKAVFTTPEVASVGLTEEEARAQGRQVRIFRTRFRPLKFSLTSCRERVMMKLVVDAGDDRVLGAHMFGDDAPEIIQALTVALEAGVTKAVLDRTMPVHPTSAEEFVLMREPVAEPNP